MKDKEGPHSDAHDTTHQQTPPNRPGGTCRVCPVSLHTCRSTPIGRCLRLTDWETRESPAGRVTASAQTQGPGQSRSWSWWWWWSEALNFLIPPRRPAPCAKPGAAPPARLLCKVTLRRRRTGGGVTIECSRHDGRCGTGRGQVSGQARLLRHLKGVPRLAPHEARRTWRPVRQRGDVAARQTGGGWSDLSDTDTATLPGSRSLRAVHATLGQHPRRRSSTFSVG
ncbi:hypothetical protein E2C01_040788 [Portunus trituberculatus]|uniref:Uncharacterized protein n=1 Tax=Portunus trituberculatus TaxID=210409 RepID=A0A5B7FRQ6_PORTR|nr:hypothetical protein [Portunus trituberculatus]